MVCVNREEKDKTILVVSENGFGKRTFIVDEDGQDVYRITNRGGKGVKTINVTEKTGKLVGILDVFGTEDLLITCQSGVTIRTPITNIKTSGRATQGVKLIKLDSGDTIAAISKIDEQDEEEELTTKPENETSELEIKDENTSSDSTTEPENNN